MNRGTSIDGCKWKVTVQRRPRQPWLDFDVLGISDIVAIAALGLPVAGLAAWLSARRRRAGGLALRPAWRMSVAEVGMIYGTAPWVWMIMLPGSRDGVNLLPLRDLLEVAAAGPATGVVVQVVGNLLVFAALGFFGPIRYAGLASVGRILLLAAGCSIVVEVAQFVLRLNRVSSIDDVLLNAAGAGLAALASRRWWRRGSPLLNETVSFSREQ
ncbi:VanZ family protein [Actinoplanes sp. NPDC049265]|uniref:VanZ family protein n=1 Tax=Actinoplanes sp. NPDC049265 TaxID=3363902 RepID=UPI003711A79F